MNAVRTLTILTSLAAPVLVAGATLTVSPAQGQESSGELRWTPHRASQPAPASVPAEPSAPRSVEAVDSQPPGETAAAPAASVPATVSLPDGVPPADAAGRQRVAETPPRRPVVRGNASSRPAAAGLPAAVGRLYDPLNPDSVLGFNILRTPRGPAGRPILAPEGSQARAMRAAADRTALGDARLGGGLAPRYAGSRAAASGRPERLAMNVEGIPSVMTQAPQVGGLDDTGVPGRTPPGAGSGRRLPTPADSGAPDAAAALPESIGPGIELPGSYGFDEGTGSDYGPAGPISISEMDSQMAGPEGFEGGLLMGEYPAQMHVESFYDDPYACDDDEGLFRLWHHDGRICAWLRRFGKPYYGWRWYRDFTASAGITGFTNATNLGLNGNFGTNEYLNWAMPLWNAFGLGWQIGWRGVQSNFQPATVEVGRTTLTKNARDQQFLTTGLFTRAFEGRGLQGGLVYDYLHDSWFDNTNVSQLRYELSYVWGYHEWGFWGASNIGDQTSLFGPVTRRQGVASTLDLYTGFYRVQFGDANEWKVWGGGTGESDGIIGTLVRAPMHRSLALEGTFTYVIPGRNQVIDFDGQGETSRFSPAAWNVSVNVVWYPAGRSRRSLASPYRPLLEVADNGSMIRSIQPFLP
jgi:hypothetical protein